MLLNAYEGLARWADIVSAASQVDDTLSATWTDVQQRAQGLAAETAA